MKTPRIVFASLAIVLPAAALAHAGTAAHDHGGFAAGLAHPFFGLDHLAAMVGVGLWSALAARRAWPDLLWAPLGFALMLLAGALAGLAGVAVPAVEPMVAASLLAIGLLVLTRLRLPAVVAAAVVGCFAVFHGLAHGYELAGDAQTWPTLAGMLLATVVLHGTGIALGWALRHRQVWLPRVAGLSVAGLGVLLLARMA